MRYIADIFFVAFFDGLLITVIAEEIFLQQIDIGLQIH